MLPNRMEISTVTDQQLRKSFACEKTHQTKQILNHKKIRFYPSNPYHPHTDPHRFEAQLHSIVTAKQQFWKFEFGSSLPKIKNLKSKI